MNESPPINSTFTTSVPRLQTERLLLREFRREDFDAFADHFADPVSAAHLIPTDRQTVWRIFCSSAGLWLIHGAGWWAVEKAAQAAMHYALEIRGEPQVRALISAANESSLRVARRLGLTFEAETEIYGKAVGSYTRTRGPAGRMPPPSSEA